MDRRDSQTARSPGTLVFPTPTACDVLTAAAVSCAAGRRPLEIRLDRVVAHRDAAGETSYLFLVPGVGAADVTALHDALTRAARPYEPHITLGRVTRDADCVALAAQLTRGVDIRAQIDAIEVIAAEGDRVTTVATAWLAGTSLEA